MSELLDLCEKAVRLAGRKGADEAEAYGMDGKQVQVFLERNDIKMGKSQVLGGIGLRAFKDKGLGFASVNILDEGEVAGMVDKAVSLASKSPSDPHNRLADPRPLREVPGLYDRESEGMEAGEVLDHGMRMLEAAKGVDSRVVVDGGIFDASVEERAIFTSHGVEGEERSSTFTYFMLAFAREGQDVGSFDYLFEGTHQVKDIKAADMGRRLGERVLKALGAQRAETFKGTVLLNPYSVEPLVAGFINSALNSNNVQKGMSRWSGKRGQRVAAEVLTVRDDGTIPGGLGSASFDREGMPHEPKSLIDAGVLSDYLYNTYTATKEGRETTGHATGSQRNVPSIGPTNFIMEAGEKPKEELVGEIDKGILVTRFSGWPQAVSGDFSGAVKGGFLIEGGDIVKPIKETLIAGNVLELLGNISGVSKDLEEVFNYRLPYLRLEDVSITSE